MVNPNRLAYWTVIVGLFLASLMGEAAAADLPKTYVALYGGITIPQSLKEGRVLNVPTEVTLSDLDLAGSAIGGAKLGMFLPGRLGWFGLETEFFYTNPHIKEQDIGFTAGGVPLGTFNFPGAHVRVATWAVNAIVRFSGSRFQPYIGVGPGVFWGRISGNDVNAAGNNFGTGSDTSIGLNALAGARFFVTKQLALFAEYKYNRATFDFGGTATLHTLYQAQHFVGGLSLHF